MTTMKYELDLTAAYQVWELVDLLSNCKSIDDKWGLEDQI